MYLSDIASEGYYSPNRPARNFGGGSVRDVDSVSGGARRSSHTYHTSPPAPPTSIPLDDNFDAHTTEVPTEWAVGDGHPDYDESVSGYRNYVTEMERMLSGQMESAARAQEWQRQDFHAQQLAQQQLNQQRHRMLRRNENSVSESVRGSSRTGDGRRRSIAASQQTPLTPRPQPALMSPPENMRQVSGKKGKIELVEQHVLEDTPSRTISLWRERVAQSSQGGNVCVDEMWSEVDSHVRHGHRRVTSGSVNGETRHGLRRVASEYARYPGSVEGDGTRNGSVRGTDNGKPIRASYERSEYMVAYRPVKNDTAKESLSPVSEGGSVALPRDLKTPSSPTLNKIYDRAPPSPKLRRHIPRKSLDRSEYITYPQTPPHTGSQASSGPTGNIQNPCSPMRGKFRHSPEDSSTLRATSTSSVEIILSSCDPSLLHIAPTLYELGIRRVDHLRAIARLTEETRDREVKEQALKRGVTVVEWAIFLDKLQSL